MCRNGIASQPCLGRRHAMGDDSAYSEPGWAGGLGGGNSPLLRHASPVRRGVKRGGGQKVQYNLEYFTEVDRTSEHGNSIAQAGNVRRNLTANMFDILDFER